MKEKLAHLVLMLGLLALSLAACNNVDATATTPALAPTHSPAPSPAGAQPSPEAADQETDRPIETGISYAVVDTGQTKCYDDDGAQIACPAEGDLWYGQDAQYVGNAPHYTDNGDGTITDHVTGLMWQSSPDTDGDGHIDAADKLTYDQALAGADAFRLAGYDDWRLPSIKELYSLIDFSGLDPSGYPGRDTSGLVPFIDTDYFDFAYGDTAAGERIIDAQYASSTRYVATTMNGSETRFGVNLADGRIKGYGLSLRGREKSFFVLYVRGNPGYGVNDFVDNGDGTITDNATGLMWQQDDSGRGLNWEESLAYCQNATTAGYDDWRLPNAKELQSIVDYGRSPDTTGSAAIDPLFVATAITNEAGQTDYPAYWSSTTHANVVNGKNAAYVAFGRSLGYMNGAWIDVHGAGSQRSDPKSGDPAQWPTGHGPQGDAIRIYNDARCVRGGASVRVSTEEADPDSQPRSERPAGGPGQGPDLAAAAAELGVSEQALRKALGDPGQGPPDLAAAAQELGLSQAALQAALGLPNSPLPEQPPAGDPPPDGQDGGG